MFVKERHSQILERVGREGRVLVSDLAREFEVSEDCIRKDLKKLEGDGLLKRVYGGAVSTSDSPVASVQKRMGVNLAAKQAIAQKAYAQIADGDTIYLDISTTAFALAQLLAQGSKRCTVVSGMLDALSVMCANPLLTVIGTGGTVNAEFSGFLGATTLAMLGGIYFDKAFVGALGVDSETGGVSTFDIDDVQVKQLVIKNSTHRFLLVDSHKFGTRGRYSYAMLGDFDAIVVDEVTPTLATFAQERELTLL